MSAILSADDLNDFISPGVACIKPVETLPALPKDGSNPYEVIREDKAPPVDLGPAQISLTDCLACSGCVTSAEAILVSLQSHTEVLATLDSAPSSTRFVALVSPQTQASLAAAFGVTTHEAGSMISQLLRGSSGLTRPFDLVLSTTAADPLALEYAATELQHVLSTPTSKKPLLTSSCPGFVCYLESTQPALIPHLSALKSPQAILATAVKALLGVPDSVYCIAVMPCFDKKLEASRTELTSTTWTGGPAVRDIDCVITTRELLSLAAARNINFATLPRTPVPQELELPGGAPVSNFLGQQRRRKGEGTSGGFLTYVVERLLQEHPGAQLRVEKGRNVDTVDYVVYREPAEGEGRVGGEVVIARLARCYGFRNIQNLVRRLKPAPNRVLPRFGKGAARKVTAVAGRTKTGAGNSAEYMYIEVMACPGGCTNGGGQIKFGDDVVSIPSAAGNQKEWLARVDEAYYSADEEEGEGEGDIDDVEAFLAAWELATGVGREKLLYTTYRVVENDLGGRLEKEVSAAELAGKAGGGW